MVASDRHLGGKVAVIYADQNSDGLSAPNISHSFSYGTEGGGAQLASQRKVIHTQVLVMSDISLLPRAYQTPEPFSRPTASIVLAPTLEPIPGSAVVTPAARESPGPQSSHKATRNLDEADLSHALEQVEIAADVEGDRQDVGSYFAPVTNEPASTSGLITPGGRQRPAIDIPVSTADQPSFSSYPHQPLIDSSIASTSSKGKIFRNFSLRHPSIRSKSRLRRRQVGVSESEDEGGVTSDDGDISPSGRRRSTSLSTAQSNLPKHVFRSTPTNIFGRRRAGSVGARLAAEYHEGDDEAWKQMAKVESARLLPSPEAPFTYQQPMDSLYTLHSATSTIKPMTSPTINPRRSSLSSADMPLGIVGSQEVLESTEELSMPHEPPPRRSSLDMTPIPAVTQNHEAIYESAPLDARPSMSPSLVSSSITCSDPSILSPTTSSQEHPLSSATTSLSRSAKSAKEGIEEHDNALSAVRLQRSLEWEAKQNKRRRRLDKRKMVLLELVETEVAYAEGLRALVQVYLPQLAALPAVSERTASMIARNASELLEFHANLATRMVEILKIEGIGYDIIHDPDVPVERASRKVASLFIEHLGLLAGYNQFCAGSIAAATLVRHIGLRTDYDSYERRCQIIWASHSPVTLRDLLAAETPNGELSIRSRLHFRDYLIMPIQRICRYPLLLGQLRSTALTPSVENHDSDSDDASDVGVDVEVALTYMRQVASSADEARRVKEAEVKSATILERLEPHVALSPSFIKSLGTCRLIGSLDVLHHHHLIAPLVPPVKVKYLAAFLYRGYLILAKVKRGKVYEAKHFLPLEVFELIDIAEGFLPHSIRLTLRDHNFELAASCEAEKDVWAAALREARDEGVIPPFELPASVSPFATKTRRMSTAHLAMEAVISPKRHSLDVHATGSDESIESPAMVHSASMSASYASVPAAEMRPSQSSAVLLRRPSTNARLFVDRCLLDVFSESCAQARSKAQLNHPLFLPDTTSHDMRDRISMRESTMLRRRTSFLDSKSSSVDISFHGQVRGSVIPVRQTKSQHGRSRIARPRRGSIGDDSATDLGVSADETITNSDHGHSFHRRSSSGYTTTLSTPATPLLCEEPHRYSTSDMEYSRPSSINYSAPMVQQTLQMRVINQTPLLRRKTASSLNLKGKPSQLRTRSMPVSPNESPIINEDPPPLPPKSGALQLNRGISYFPLNTEVEPSVGLGLIESSMDTERPKSWHTLRRSMSFLRSGSKMDDAPMGSSSSYFPDISTIGTSTRPASYASSSSTSGLQSSPSSALSQFGVKSPATKSSDDVTLTASETGSAPNTPKRKKSLLLTRLRGFTAM